MPNNPPWKVMDRTNYPKYNPKSSFLNRKYLRFIILSHLLCKWVCCRSKYMLFFQFLWYSMYCFYIHFVISDMSLALVSGNSQWTVCPIGHLTTVCTAGVKRLAVISFYSVSVLQYLNCLNLRHWYWSDNVFTREPFWYNIFISVIWFRLESSDQM